MGNVLQLLDYIDANASSLNAATQKELAVFLKEVWDFMEQYNQREQAQKSQQPEEAITAPINTPASNDAQLLWVLAGQQDQAFISYLRTYPTPASASKSNVSSELITMSPVPVEAMLTEPVPD